MSDKFHRDDYIGLPSSRAQALAADRGWEPRRLTADMVITADYKQGRLNLLVGDDDVVVDASLG